MNMSPMMHNNLRFYTLRMNESTEMAEQMALDFEDKLDKLDKYDQMEVARVIDMDGWESAFELVDSLSN